MVRSDAELVHKTLAGDREAFGVLVDRHRRAVYVLALQRGFQPAEAEDVAQEVFLKAYRSLGALKDGHAFERWIYGIAAHVSADWARERKRRRREESGLEEVFSGAVVSEGDAGSGGSEEVEQVLRALNGLDEDQRLVVTLRYLHGLTPKQIAERLGEPRGTIRSRLHHALNYLQTAFGGMQEMGAAEQSLGRGSRRPAGEEGVL